jgi:hypothetical protein
MVASDCCGVNKVIAAEFWLKNLAEKCPAGISLKSSSAVNKRPQVYNIVIYLI